MLLSEVEGPEPGAIGVVCDGAHRNGGRLDIRRLLLAAAALAALNAAPALAHTRAWSEWHRCSQAQVIPCIEFAADRYKQPIAIAERVAWCESRDEWSASNGSDLGLFEINWEPWPEHSTWAWAPDGTPENPYWHRSPWSARYNALTAMWLWSIGRKDQWACQ